MRRQRTAVALTEVAAASLDRAEYEQLRKVDEMQQVIDPNTPTVLLVTAWGCHTTLYMQLWCRGSHYHERHTSKFRQLVQYSTNSCHTAPISHTHHD